VAKLVDALPSGGSVRKDVLVRIQSWAQRPCLSFAEAGLFIWKRCEFIRISGQIKSPKADKEAGVFGYTYNEIVHEGYGNIHIMLPAGLYQLRIEFNEYVEDRHYRVVADTTDRFQDAEYQTSSSIPVFGLNNTHEYFSDPSTEWSQKFTGKTNAKSSGSSEVLCPGENIG
jgi:hypothetical protein